MQTVSRARAGAESGVVAVLLAITVVPILVGAAALGVDLSRLHLVGQQLQRAADAAALGGVVHLPGEPAQAFAAARAVAVANGVPADRVASELPSGRAGRLRVTVSADVTGAFAGALGVAPRRLARSATAEFAGPLMLGSPCNVFGREDMDPAGGGPDQQRRGTSQCAGSGRFWAGAMGPQLDKGAGDAFASRWCAWAPSEPPTDGCHASGVGPRPPGTNLEALDGGYSYVVRVAKPGRLRLQGYDMAWVSAGPLCSGVLTTSGMVNPILGAAAVTSNEFVSSGAGGNARYATGASAYCTGDTQELYPFADSSPTGLRLDTTVSVHRPGRNPYDVGASLCAPVTFPGVEGANTRITDLLKTGAGGELGWQVRRTFHRWVDLCPGVEVAPGDYTINVSTSAGSGANRFALRGWLEGQPDGVALMARERMQVFANIPSGVSQFHLVRVDSTAAGRTLEVSVFDIGDAEQDLTVELLAPDSTSAWGPCVLSGAIAATQPTCVATVRRSVTNARWLRFAVDIPATYRCSDDTDNARCWVRARITSSATVYDATTWTARASGDPVRLVE